MIKFATAVTMTDVDCVARHEIVQGRKTQRVQMRGYQRGASGLVKFGEPSSHQLSHELCHWRQQP